MLAPREVVACARSPRLLAGLVLCGLLGCAHRPPTAPPAAAPPSTPADSTPAPSPGPGAKAAAPAPAPGAASAPVPASSAPARAAAGTAARAPPSKRSAPASSAPAAATTAAAAAPPAPAALDLASLEQRLRDTHAIGVFTKLSLKNQVDDLLAQFRAFYAGQGGLTLTGLRRTYELLLMKVVTLLQEDDPGLAGAVASSREAIWAILSDRNRFNRL